MKIWYLRWSHYESGDIFYEEKFFATEEGCRSFRATLVECYRTVGYDIPDAHITEPQSFMLES